MTFSVDTIEGHDGDPATPGSAMADALRATPPSGLTVAIGAIRRLLAPPGDDRHSR